MSDVVRFFQPRIRLVLCVFSGRPVEGTDGNMPELADLFSAEYFCLVLTILGTILILCALKKLVPRVQLMLWKHLEGILKRGTRAGRRTVPWEDPDVSVLCMQEDVLVWCE